MRRFSIAAWIDHCKMYEYDYLTGLRMGWPIDCEGMTEDEMNEIGCYIADQSWMVEDIKEA